MVRFKWLAIINTIFFMFWTVSFAWYSFFPDMRMSIHEAIAAITSLADLPIDVDITSSYSGTPIEGLEAGESISAGDVVFVASDGDLEQYDANADGPVGSFGLALETGASGEIDVLRDGAYYSAAHGITVGHQVCASETAGDFEDCATTSAAWDTDGDVLHEIGLAVSANVIYFDFGKLAVVHE